jgi:probable addiction module antidote protein
MRKKTVDWNVGLMEDLKDPEFAKGFVEACLEEGVPLQVALGKVVKAQGYSAVARKINMAVPNVMRAVQPKANPTIATVTKLLNGVGLTFAVGFLKAPIRKRGPRKLASAA